MKLSIIIPYYNTLEETKELLNVLEPQLTNEVEVIVIDDGCNCKELDNYKVKVIHLEKNSGNASIPRNKGLEIALGEYIGFIDSDDLVSNDYIPQILNKIRKQPDIIYISWKSTETEVIANNMLPGWNCAVWCRVYKRTLIEDRRFDETLVIAEDWKFNQGLKPIRIKSIKTPIYFYNIRNGSLTRRK